MKARSHENTPPAESARDCDVRSASTIFAEAFGNWGEELVPPLNATPERQKVIKNFDRNEFYDIIEIPFNIPNNMKPAIQALAALEKLESDLKNTHNPSEVLSQEIIDTLERILGYVRTAVEPGTWAPLQAVASKTPDHTLPPLPTAEDMAKDPLKTWVGRDKKLRVLDKDGNLQPESPLDFFKRVYAPWVGVITKGHIKHIDLSLYTAFNHWTKNGKNSIPEIVLPNMVHRWKDDTPTPEEIKIYNKVNALMRRKA